MRVSARPSLDQQSRLASAGVPVKVARAELRCSVKATRRHCTKQAQVSGLVMVESEASSAMRPAMVPKKALKPRAGLSTKRVPRLYPKKRRLNQPSGPA